MVLVNCRVNTGTEEFCTVYCALVQYRSSRMRHWTLICLWLAAVTTAMATEGEREKQEGERDILASVRDILYEDVASNEIDTDGPALQR
jgi:hypothetical protein